ncbi:MAG: hypothetical protein LOD88_07965 [Novibacillus thermophilus]|jgi:L-amino acid N-acyltransferase YncA|uniref:Uncharacterized protein n=1 Tax=Novibacillus thermophilus TaxID=1471761 RepID=A0A1U9K3K3_9BACL|nr:hypothetical protein [Novibacillus thermophilus]AQS54622.1 hypothetical protein B0W44_01310 [Novibacillus thermophilus]
MSLAGIATGNATFEGGTAEVGGLGNSHLFSCRIVVVRQRRVVGWEAISPVRNRCVYTGVAEVRVHGLHGKGIAKTEIIGDSPHLWYYSV